MPTLKEVKVSLHEVKLFVETVVFYFTITDDLAESQ